MTANEIMFRFIEGFDALGVPYMLVGSYSSNVYGRPRLTKDADFVVQLDGDPMPALTKFLGAEFIVDPQMSFESVTGTMRYIAAHRTSAFKVEMFLLSSDDHDRARFRSRRLIDFEGRRLWLPRPEDVVITKLRWSMGGNRAKDVEDVRQILAMRADQLDMGYIRGWTDQHGTRELFEKILARVQSEAQPKS